MCRERERDIAIYASRALNETCAWTPSMVLSQLSVQTNISGGRVVSASLGHWLFVIQHLWGSRLHSASLGWSGPPAAKLNHDFPADTELGKSRLVQASLGQWLKNQHISGSRLSWASQGKSRLV
jgi:hypothetical protein